MPWENWDERFDGAIAEKDEWQAAYDELLAARANPIVVRKLLNNMWSAETDFVEAHRKRLAGALIEAERLLADMNDLSRQMVQFQDAVLEALKNEPDGLAFFEQHNLLRPLAIQLCNCAAWLEGYVLPVFGKNTSGAKLSRKRKGKKPRTKQPILRVIEVCMTTLLEYLRLIDDNRPHAKAVAHLMTAAAKASGVPVHWRIDSHWVSVTEKRVQAEHARIYEVIKQLAAKYVRTKAHDTR